MMKYFLILCLVFIIAACGNGDTKTVIQEITPTRDATEYFCQLAFQAGSIVKWVGPTSIKVHGSPTEADLSELNAIITEINELGGSFYFEEGKTLDPADINIYYIPEYRFYEYDETYGGANLGAHFVAWWYTDTGELLEGLVLLDTELSQEERNHKAREELTQSMGLFNDAWWYEDSIFFQGASATQEYAPVDTRVIELLFDERVVPGMAEWELVDIPSLSK